MVRFWSNPIELGAEVVYGLMHLQKSKPSGGWIRGDRPRIEDEREILRLKEEIIRLQAELDSKDAESGIEDIRSCYERTPNKMLDVKIFSDDRKEITQLKFPQSRLVDIGLGAIRLTRPYHSLPRRTA